MYLSCFVSIVGKPNAGKSTLLNKLVGEKVSIVSWRPQTTRNIVTGIVQGQGFQIILFDTPGIQNGKSALNDYMAKSLRSASDGADGILYVADASKRISEEEYKLIGKYCESKLPVIVALNKTDDAEPSRVAENLNGLTRYTKLFSVVPVSALKGDNTEILKEQLKKLLKESPQYYSEDTATDKTLRFMAQEIIREKALTYLNDEIPHGIGVSIIGYSLRENGMADIDAEIITAKASHKPIIIGKGGAMLKKIASAARADIEKLSGERVCLKIWVKIREGWQDDYNLLREMGYDKRDI